MTRRALFCRLCAPVIGIIFGGSSPLAQAASPSFDCGKASAPDELAICADDGLAGLDRETAAAWRRLRGTDKDSATRIARELMAARKACGADRGCIRKSQEQALANFRAAGSTAAQVDQPATPAAQRGANNGIATDDGSIFLKCRPTTACSNYHQKKTSGPHDTWPKYDDPSQCDNIKEWLSEHTVEIGPDWQKTGLSFTKSWYVNGPPSSRNFDASISRETQEYKVNWYKEEAYDNYGASVEGICYPTAPRRAF